MQDELGYVEKRQLLNAANALIASGLDAKSVAKALGIPERDINAHTREMRERARMLVGVGPNPMAATAHVVLRGVLRALNERYKTPDDFGNPESRRDVRNAARLLRRLLAWPTRADPLVEEIAERALAFLKLATLEHATAHDLATLLTIGDAVAGFVGQNIEAIERSNTGGDVFVAAEDIIVRTRPSSQDEPVLDDRARAILALADDELAGQTEIQPE